MVKQKGDVGTSAVSAPVSGPNPMAASTKGRYGQDFNKDGRISLGERFRDATDGGGAGVSGGPFRGGGLISAFANALTGNNGVGVGPEAGVGFAGYGYHGPDGWVPAGVDMQNGGGPGMAGPYFQGGAHYSGLLNFLGIRPMGFEGERPEMTVGETKNPALSQVLATTAMAQPMPMAASYYPSYAMSMPLSGMGGMMPNMAYT
jgi:hypothetical protein